LKKDIAMKKSMLMSLSLLLVAASLTACTNRDMGTIGGAAVGGIVGSAVTGGSGLGTVAGAIGGGVIGNQLTR
jgi:osmotically inducible lipoprotein OsmB